MSDDRVPMTREGYEKLKSDLDRMQNVEMIEVAKRIAAARELGDLSENAEYHAAREDQGMLQARIDSKNSQLARAYIVDRSSLPDDAVVFGARVRIKNLGSYLAWQNPARTAGAHGIVCSGAEAAAVPRRLDRSWLTTSSPCATSARPTATRSCSTT